jgi:parallel beta-helix repeat protein
MGTVERRAASLLAVLACAFLSMGMGKCQGTIHVRDGESIQDAVDRAVPGDVIRVGPGFYTGDGPGQAVVEVLKDDITLIGTPSAVIDATGYDYAVKVGDRSYGCLAGAIRNFNIVGFTFQNSENSGVFLANVDGYSMVGGRYLDNAEYGPYPVCSRDGVVTGNFASGHEDAAIYVGQSDGALIEHNRVIDSIIGIEIENTANTIVRRNITSGNTAGIFVVVLPGLDIPAATDVLIEDNLVLANNRENTSSDGNLALLPEGTGILNLGGDNVVIRNNVVLHNRSLGIASAGNPFSVLDPRIEPFVDGLVVEDNIVMNNGYDPDEDRALTDGADIVYAADVLFPPVIPFPPIPDPDPFDNCFSGNRYKTENVEAQAAPGATLADFPCP